VEEEQDAGCKIKLFVSVKPDHPQKNYAGITHMAKQIKKNDLPQKTCVVCGRPFTWRKKWEKVWADVKYCSDRCRETRKTSLLPTDK